jgi:hypothetical protein
LSQDTGFLGSVFDGLKNIANSFRPNQFSKPTKEAVIWCLLKGSEACKPLEGLIES